MTSALGTRTVLCSICHRDTPHYRRLVIGERSGAPVTVWVCIACGAANDATL